MRKFIAIVLVVAMATITWPAALAAAPPGQATGGVNGTALDANKNPLGNHTIQLRNAQTGQLVGSTTSGASGTFTFTGIPPGNFIIEIVDAAGNILGTATATVTAGVVTTVAVTATAAGAAAMAAGTAGGLAGLFTGTSLLVISAAAAGGIAIYVATKDEASPSR
jgi:hypothetical protein